MRARKVFEMLALTSIGLLMLSSGVVAAGGAAGGGAGGGGSTPDLGDLIILYRDAHGVPIPSPATSVEDPETGYIVSGGQCWQPIAFNYSDPADLLDLCPAECVVDSLPSGENVVAVDQYSCGIEVGCSGCTREVDFGRINEVRSPDRVLESQLEDVIINLATADCVTLDPAGRLVTSRVTDDTVSTGAIDSPLQNLALYRQLMLTGTQGLPLPQGTNVFDTAARALGAASDKSGEVNADLVAYLNQIMGLTEPGETKICKQYREEVKGVMQEVKKCFLNYGPDVVDDWGKTIKGANYNYQRKSNFLTLPDPAYIPAGDPVEGWFEYLALTGDNSFSIIEGPILDAVFCVDGDGSPVDPDFLTGLCVSGDIDSGFLKGNIGGFAQAADDSRAVIDYMHSNPVPEDYVTPLECTASGDITYDVSLSDVSGLQVPKNIVDGSEGREFTVTVANAGPSEAAGSVTVTATAANGVSIIGSPWSFPFSDLTAGAGESFVQFFSIDLGQKTTITWTAEVFAVHDVNLTNNAVTATSNVKVTGSGRRN